MKCFVCFSSPISADIHAMKNSSSFSACLIHTISASLITYFSFMLFKTHSIPFIDGKYDKAEIDFVDIPLLKFSDAAVKFFDI